MCTKPALRAPPLRLPAFRALPPLMLMMRPQPAVFMNGMMARAQRSAPTYLTLKSSIKSSSMTVSIGPVAVAEPPGADPLLTRMCRYMDRNYVSEFVDLQPPVGSEGFRI